MIRGRGGDAAHHRARHDAAPAPDLLDLQGRERAQRIAVAGLVLVFYGAGWLLFAWRASRIEATECSVVRVPAGLCTIQHTAGAETFELPYRTCDGRTRWRDDRGHVLDVGTTVPCYYYPSFPGDIVLERPAHRWARPLPIGATAAGAALVAIGLAGMLRRRRVHAPPTPASVYRAPAARAVVTRAPLAIDLIQKHWTRWLGAGPFVLLGLVLAGLTLYTGWTATGELGGAAFALTSLSSVVLGTGLAGFFMRANLILDADRNLVVFWWGLGRPWFRSYRALDTLLRAEAETRGFGRGITHHLTLHYEGGAVQRHRMLPEEAQRIAAQIHAYRAGNPPIAA